MSAAIVWSGAAAGAIVVRETGLQGPPGPQGSTAVGTIDFVADCGADPTGVADCAAAITAMWTKLSTLAADPTLPQSTLRVFVPPGKYSVRSSPSNPDFNGKTTSFEIFGCGDASIFQIGVGVGGYAFAAANIFRAHFHDLAFVGLGNGLAADCNVAITVSPRWGLILERVKFESLLATTAIVLSNSGPSHLRHCEFGGCGALAAVGGCFYSLSGTTELIQTNFSDIPNLNGYTFPGNKSFSCTNWVYIKDSALGTSGGVTYVRDCLFDESQQCALFIEGGPTARIPLVKLENITVLASAIAGSIGAIYVHNVDKLDVDGYIASGFANRSIDIPVLKLSSVTSYKLKGISLPDSLALFREVTTDASCSGTIEDSPNVVVSRVLAASRPQSARGTAAHGGGTFVVDVPVPLNTSVRLRARVLMTTLTSDATRSQGSAGLVARCGVDNKNGIASFGTAITSSTNPMNSSNLAALENQWADAPFVNGATMPTAVWTVTGDKARLTITNPGTTFDADVTVSIEQDQAATPITLIAGPSALATSLLAWYRADKGLVLDGSGNVSGWNDQSGSGDANRNLAQATSGKRPAYVANDSVAANRPAMHFVAASLQYLTSGAWAGGPFVEPYTVMVIARDDGSATSQVFVDNQVGAAGENLVWNQAGNYFVAGTSTGVAASATPKIFIAEHNGGTSPVNISTNTGANLGALGENVTGLTVGATITPGVYLNGYVYEIAIWNRVLTATEKAQLNAYAAQRYGIGVSP